MDDFVNLRMEGCEPAICEPPPVPRDIITSEGLQEIIRIKMSRECKDVGEATQLRQVLMEGINAVIDRLFPGERTD